MTVNSSLAAPIFSVRLVPDKNLSVRALHARQIDVSFLEGARSTDPDFASFVTTLGALDRRQLVVLTSAFGLAALRRLTLELSGTAGNVTPTYQDDAKGMGKRPQAYYRYLSDLSLSYSVKGSDTRYPVFQEGILMPQPSDEFGLLLSPYGATMNAKWKGEPPAPLTEGDFFHDALDLESYEHRSVYGRDMLVKVASKGFMFPLGHRASLIKLSQREMLSFQGDATSGNAAAYQTQSENTNRPNACAILQPDKLR